MLMEYSAPSVAITFDDGPDNTHTPHLLGLLRSQGICCTFFVVGNRVTRNPALLRQMLADGHEIGNHSWSHQRLDVLKTEDFLLEVQRCHDAIQNATGVATRLFRPTYGCLLTSQKSLIIDHFNYRIVRWNVDPNDWKRPGIDSIVSHTATSATNGSIILLHDIHASTVAAIPPLLSKLSEMGFKFSTISQLSKNEPHKS